MKISLDNRKSGRPKKERADVKDTHIKVYLPKSVREAFIDYCSSQSTNCSSFLGNVISQILSDGGTSNERKD